MSKEQSNGSAHRGEPAVRERNRVYPIIYWVGFMTSILERIALAATLHEAKGHARHGLESVTHHTDGLEFIDPDIRLRLRAVVEGEDEHE